MIKIKRVNTLFISILGISFCSPTLAIENTDYLNGNGIRLGSFLLTPSMTVENEYDTNIFKRDSQLGEVDSYIVHFRPGFTLGSDWSKHLLNFSLMTDVAEYATLAEQNNYADVTLNLKGRVDMLRDSFFELDFSYNLLHEDRGSPDQRGGSEPTSYESFPLILSYTHKFNRLKLIPQFQFSRIDYQDTATTSPAGDLKQSTRSRWEYNPSFHIGYEVYTGYEAFILFKWTEIIYDNLVSVVGNQNGIFDRDSSGYNILTGMAFDVTNLVKGDVSIGYRHRSYADSNLPTISGINGFIGLDWTPTQLTTISLDFSHDINETTQNGVSGVVATRPHINISHELRRNIIVNIGGGYTHNEYNGFNPNNPIIANRIDRLDNIYNANVGVNYHANRYFSLSLDYTYGNRNANYDLSDYETNQIMLGITGQL